MYGIVAPRYNTQLFGLALAVALLMVSIVLIRRGWLKYRRFWLVLALLSLGMFGISFYRGDPVPLVAGWRADEWLDLGIGLLCAAALVRGGDLPHQYNGAS